MTATVACAEASYRDQPLHARNLHGVDKDAGRLREQCCAFEDGSRRDVDAESLDDHVYSLKGAPDRAAIKRVAGHLLQSRILDGYARRRTSQRANIMAGEKGSLHRFKSDAAAGAN